MQTAKIVQAVILMIIVALAASCTPGKEYASKLFRSRQPANKDTQAVAIRFLETENDSLPDNKTKWVRNEKTVATDTAAISKSEPVITETKPVPPQTEPVVKTSKPGEVRTKRTRDQ